MKKRLTGLLICLGLAGCAQAAHAEFGTGFGGTSVLLEGMIEGIGAADNCLGALFLIGFALVINMIRYGVIRPAVTAIRCRLGVRKLRDIDSIREVDPDFDPEEVADWVRNLYTRLQREWETEGDMGSEPDRYLRPVSRELGEKILEKNRKRLCRLVRKGVGRHTSDITFRDVSADGWRRKKDKDFLNVKVQLERAAWYTNWKGGCYKGTTPDIKRVSYTWRLSRPAGSVTAAEKNTCKCGETVSPLYGECPYCGKWLRRPEDAWVLEEIIENESPRTIGRRPAPQKTTGTRRATGRKRRLEAANGQGEAEQN